MIPRDSKEIEEANRIENEKFKRWQKKEQFQYELSIWTKIAASWLGILLLVGGIIYFLINYC
jgi:hypothetical protein